MTRQGLWQVKPGQARALLLSLAVIAGAACERGRAGKAMDVGGAYIVLPPVEGRPGTLYFTIDAAAPIAPGKKRELTSVHVEGATRAEMHRSMTMHGMARMRPLAAVPLPEGVTRFCPGGNHVMLFGLDERLKPGTRTRVHLRLDNGRHLDPDATVVSLGDKVSAEPPFDCKYAS